MNLESYWGEIKEPDVKPPVIFFREQATALAKVTNGILTGKVEVFPLDSGKIRSELWVTAPLLSNYAYLLLSVEHSLALYPAVLYIFPKTVKNSAETKVCRTAEEFNTNFKNALSSSEVVKVIQSLLAMSKSS